MIPNIRTMFILGTLTVLLLIIFFTKAVKADTFYYICHADNNRWIYTENYPTNCNTIELNVVKSTYTKKEMRSMVSRQQAYERKSYKDSVKNTARFLNDVEKARKTYR